jgi:hypothetical protein
MVLQIDLGLERIEIDIMTDVEIRKKDEMFSSISIDDSSRNSYSRRNWTPGEDAKLLTLVNEGQSRKWKKISVYFGNKTVQQCAYRYNRLMIDMNKSKWNRNDDILLLELSEVYGQNWAYIATIMPEGLLMI